MAKKKTTKKKAAKKPTPKKPVKKPAVKKKSVAKKAPAKKPVTKKTAKKKPVVKKKTATKKVVKKAAKKKPVATKKAPAKKANPKKTTTKKVVKKAPAKKAAVNKTTKKTATKKKPTKKSVVKKPPAKPAAPAKPKAVKPEDMTLEQAMEKEWSIPQLKRVKTGMKKKELNAYLKLLLEKRAEIVGNVQGMEEARNAALGDIAHMPLHMADVGSDNFEQELTLGLMESERKLLSEIDEAILRMREGYYGVCVASARPINSARLEAKPWAKYCIEVARFREQRGW